MFNRYFQFDQVFVDPESRTVICMTPKVMTMFIRNTLNAGYRRFHDRRPASGTAYRLPALAKRFEQTKPSAFLDAARRPQNYQAYGFVRNPYWRLHSAWRNKLHDPWNDIEAGKRSAYPPSIRYTHLPQIRVWAAAKGLPGGAPDAHIPFDTFVRFVAARPEWARNRHWRNQAPMLQPGHFPDMRRFRIETELKEGALEIFPRLGFRRRWVKRRLQKPTNVSSGVAGSPYTEETAALAFSAFRTDFDAFGYDPDSWKVRG